MPPQAVRYVLRDATVALAAVSATVMSDTEAIVARARAETWGPWFGDLAGLLFLTGMLTILAAALLILAWLHSPRADDTSLAEQDAIDDALALCLPTSEAFLVRACPVWAMFSSAAHAVQRRLSKHPVSTRAGIPEGSAWPSPSSRGWCYLPSSKALIAIPSSLCRCGCSMSASSLRESSSATWCSAGTLVCSATSDTEATSTPACKLAAPFGLRFQCLSLWFGGGFLRARSQHFEKRCGLFAPSQ